MTDDDHARLAALRDELWEAGEIMLAGLRRMDRALGIETYLEGGGIRRASDERG